MGLFGRTPAAEPVAPNRSQRAVCWEGRDAYFKCLDAHDIVNPDSKENRDKAKKMCGKEEQQFVSGCVQSWVEYFKKRRLMETNRAEMLAKLAKEGAQGIDVVNESRLQ